MVSVLVRRQETQKLLKVKKRQLLKLRRRKKKKRRRRKRRKSKPWALSKRNTENKRCIHMQPNITSRHCFHTKNNLISTGRAVNTYSGIVEAIYKCTKYLRTPPCQLPVGIL